MRTGGSEVLGEIEGTSARGLLEHTASFPANAGPALADSVRKTECCLYLACVRLTGTRTIKLASNYSVFFACLAMDDATPKRLFSSRSARKSDAHPSEHQLISLQLYGRAVLSVMHRGSHFAL